MMPTLRFLAASLVVSAISWSSHAADGVDTSPLPIKTVRAYPNLKPRRPVAITHAGDGSGRLFVVSEYGQLVILPKDQDMTEMKTFLDIEYKVDYEDKE